MTPPKPASTVVALRPTREQYEVCLIRRHDEVAFMGGAHVFPGGRLDPADRVDPGDERYQGAAAAIAALCELPPSDALVHYAGAVRQLSEEAGIRLSRLDLLIPFAHWTTPGSEAKRYDVRFFLAAAPEEQTSLRGGRENPDVLWIAPSDAIARCRDDELMLAPPTWTTLRWLERFTRIEDVVRWGRALKPGRVQPILFEHEGRRMLALPGDPLYPPVDGFDTPTETRFVFADGRWKPIDLPAGSP